MNSKKVGIVGGWGELHTMHMKEVLESLGAEPVIIDTLRFPQQVSFSLKDDTPLYNGNDISEIRSFYNRTVFYSEPPYDLQDKIESGQLPNLDGWYSAYTAERERQSLLGSWMRAVAFAADRVVNPVESFHLHFLKPHQLVLLKRAGIRIPETLVTNNPNELLSFKKEFGQIVYKPVAGGASCKLLKDDDLTPERLELLSTAPVLFQKLHAGLDIRVFVLAGKVLCALEIETDPDTIDFRGNETAMKVVEIPEQVGQMCLKAAEICSMVFSGIDVKKTADEYVLLECNPSPMFMGFQSRSGYPIAQDLANYLIA